MAQDAFSLLNIDKQFIEDFSLQALGVTDRRSEQALEKEMKRLADIEQSMLTDVKPTATKRSLDAIIKKVKSAIKGKNITWAAYELRTISYYIMYFEPNEIEFNYAIDLLSENWKPLFFNGLVFYILNTWNSIKPQYRTRVCKLINSQLKVYQGKNRKYLLLKSRGNLLEESGPLRMSALLEQKKMSITDAPTLFGFKPTSINMSYYSDVIVKYFSKSEHIDLDKIADVLIEHKNDRTTKLLLAELVRQAERSNDLFFQSRVSKLGNRLLSDVTLPAAWAPFPGATSEQITKLRRARELVNQWFVRQVIEVFFEICVQDFSRKFFWLKYCQYISKFYIVGSSLVRSKIQNDDRVGSILKTHFINTNSTKIQTAALIMFVKDKVFVEFSDLGALYVYKQEDSIIKFIKRGIKYISKIDDLKRPSMDPLIYSSYGYLDFEEEGRMPHYDNWQFRLSKWMTSKIIYKTNFRYIEDEDNKMFQPVGYAQQSVKFEFREEQIPIFDEPEPIIEKITYFKKFVAEDVKSKTLENNRAYIVANIYGFYICVTKGGLSNRRYYHIMPIPSPVPKYKVSGYLWFNKKNKNNWSRVDFFYAGETKPIGYIKVEGTSVLFKESQRADVIKKITF